MIGVIVTGHGNFATGLTSSVKLIAGSPENYVPVDFTQDKSTDDLERELREAIDLLKASCSGILIFTDLVGGSPFKVSAELSVELKDFVPIAVLSGTNLGMLVEGNMSRSFMEDLNDLADSLVETGKTQVIHYEFAAPAHEEPEDGDGI